MKKWLQPKRFFIAALVIVALCVTAITFISLNRGNDSRTALRASPVGEAVESVIPDGQLASVMVTPATKEWWEKLDYFVPGADLDLVDFSSLSHKPVQLGWSVSIPKDYESAGAFGLNTIYMEYANADEAMSVSGELSLTMSNTVQAIALGDVVMLIPTGSYTDSEYNLERYENLKKEASSSVGESAKWSINFEQMQKAIIYNNDDKAKSMFESMLTSFGAKLATGDSYWSGSSADGLHWDGKFSTTGLWSAAGINTNDLLAAMGQNSQTYLADGTPVTQEELDKIYAETQARIEAEQKKFAEENPGATEQPANSTGVVNGTVTDPGSGILNQYTQIQTGGKAFGAEVQYETGELIPAKPLPDSKNTVITVDPNAWLSNVAIPGSNAGPYFKFDQVKITFMDDSRDVDIDLRVAPWKDSYQEADQGPIEPVEVKNPETDVPPVPSE